MYNKPHEIPINEAIKSEHSFASSFGRSSNKELRVHTSDNEVTFIVKNQKMIVYEGRNRADAVSIYNSYL